MPILIHLPCSDPHLEFLTARGAMRSDQGRAAILWMWAVAGVPVEIENTKGNGLPHLSISCSFFQPPLYTQFLSFHLCHLRFAIEVAPWCKHPSISPATPILQTQPYLQPLSHIISNLHWDAYSMSKKNCDNLPGPIFARVLGRQTLKAKKVFADEALLLNIFEC